MISAKDGGEDVNNWSMQELIKVVDDYVAANRPTVVKSADTTGNSSVIESRPIDAYARLTEMMYANKVDCKPL